MCFYCFYFYPKSKIDDSVTSSNLSGVSSSTKKNFFKECVYCCDKKMQFILMMKFHEILFCFSNFKSCSVDDDSSVGTSNAKETKTWRMIKDKVAQAVEDYKSNRSVKDEDSDLDDISESSVK